MSLVAMRVLTRILIMEPRKTGRRMEVEAEVKMVGGRERREREVVHMVIAFVGEGERR